MSELDEKLRDILSKTIVKIRVQYSVPDKAFDTEDIIAGAETQIKQLFADEGYIKVLLPSDDGYEIPKHFMSGQEWYAAFRQEFDNLPYRYDEQVEIIKAAKKASSIDSFNEGVR